MSTANTPAKVSSAARRVWKSAQMYIGFHRDQSGRMREEPTLFTPKNGSASIHPDPSTKEAMLIVKAADPKTTQDVEIVLQPTRLVVRRDAEMWWQAFAVEEDTIKVRMADGATIVIGHDGSVKRRSAEDETHVEADGSIFKVTEHAESHMTGDGVEMTRRTPDRIASITADGVVDRARSR